MKPYKMRQISIILIVLFFATSSCKKNSSSSKGGSSDSETTGWSAEEMKKFGFDDPRFLDQTTGPGLALVQGGTFTMGRVEDDVMADWNNVPRRVTVASFYIDKTEVTNYDYRQYLTWLSFVYPDNPEKYKTALPDTLVWRKALAFNEPYINNYLRHPTYSQYPVVGVNWRQATDYCKWRTDRVNEKLLIDFGYIKFDPEQKNKNVFTTEAYLTGQYAGISAKKDSSRVRWEEGIMLPEYRLPTEAEWEYAALGLIGAADGELLTERRMYPWAGPFIRESNKVGKGNMKANYVRGRGDYMGMAGALNDNADISAPVTTYDPNDNGIYCMAGNVNEWVADVYRPSSPSDVEEFQPFRGNVITQYRKDSISGELVLDDFGQPVVDTIKDFRNFNDGDYLSQINESLNWSDVDSIKNQTSRMYSQANTSGEFSSLITDKSRVYKGGSWRDRPFWLNPGARRYLDEKSSSMDLGFRCAMTRLGSPTGLTK